MISKLCHWHSLGCRAPHTFRHADPPGGTQQEVSLCNSAWQACLPASTHHTTSTQRSLVVDCVPQVLAKIGERLGDVQVQVPPPGAAAAAAAASAGRPPAADVPEIDNLIDAAKYGDLEAVEDFIAIGKVCVLAREGAQGVKQHCRRGKTQIPGQSPVSCAACG